MPEERPRSLLWPVLLIVVGLVLLLDQLGLWSINLGDLLQLWPLLLVLAGLDLILRGTRLGRAVSVAVALVLVVAVGVVLWPSLTGQGPDQERSFRLPLADADRPTVLLETGAADVTVYPLTGGADAVQANVRYRARRVEVSFDVRRESGGTQLALRGRGRSWWLPFRSRDTTRWEVGLSPEVPMALVMNGGVGSARLDLTGLQLRSVTLNGGVGEVDLTLSDRGAYTVTVDGGVGNIDIVVPPAAEARIRIDEGLGSVEVDERFARAGGYYTSAGYADATDRIDIDIDGGIGEVSIR